MAIEIYSIIPNDPDAMFPAIDASVKLIGVAPLDKLDLVQLDIAERNKEAEAAGCVCRYKYSVTDVQIWE